MYIFSCLRRADKRIAPKRAKMHPAFISIDWRELETKNAIAPLRPSMLEYRKGQDKKAARKIAIPEYTGDDGLFKDF
jgi:hypothetical protein